MTTPVTIEQPEEIMDALVARVANVVMERLRADQADADGDRWLASRDAASYLGVSLGALHRLTAARAIPFEQEAPGCKCWFLVSDLVAWRRGRTP